jgi:tRNA threonylcarbamoyladenosine biosynthesis protein TsaE
MSRTWISRSELETRRLGERLAARLRGGEIVLLCGDLGVGKTQFAQGIGRGLEVDSTLVSPTFTLVVQYEGRLPLAHYDLYRVDSTAELDEIGFLEADDPRTVAVVEWGDRTEAPRGAIRVEFTLAPEGARHIRILGLELGDADSGDPSPDGSDDREAGRSPGGGGPR